MPDEDLLHEGRYHYRRTPVLVIGIVLLVIFIPLFLRFVWELVTTSALTDGRWFGVIPTAVLGLFAWVGGWLLHAYLTDRVLHLSIDRSGVRHDSRFFPWEEVRALRSQTRTYKGKWQLVLLRRSWCDWDRQLMTDEGLSDEEFDALMAKLQREVAPAFGHLRFVG